MGTNTKAEEANARKSAVKQEKNERVQKEKEDALWADDDKSIANKEKRKKERDEKKSSIASRKAENRALAEAEYVLTPGKVTAPKKVTQAEVQANVQKAEPKKPKKQKEEDVVPENVNHLIRAEKEQFDGDYVEARTVNEAITQLKEQKVDIHPEKRLKAAFSAYEERNFTRIKKENPTLKYTQQKDLLWKEWQKSPENPLNQPQGM
eukprot:TRINITY_DN5789_c0_g1_i1.p1 TRINITY_DN5789_c0_g1~~TRINITY_DN5789_c0_g1_i1.p1  ORF type:complete len:226 (+),score=77.59 TRINITY_DN5789_c0_g1_i1:60-680(+)